MLSVESCAGLQVCVNTEFTEATEKAGTCFWIVAKR
jgi:hypothetical protein